jgi:putative NADH-flavin reductase
MRIAIFGATGTVGSELLTQALGAGHEVSVLARTPSKLSGRPARLTVVPGNVRDPAAVEQTLTDCEAVLSTLGATDKHDPDVRRAGTTNIIAGMHEHGIRRLVVMGGFHLSFPGDAHNLGQRLIVPILRLSKHLVQDTTDMSELIKASKLDWTLVRTPRVVSRSQGSGSPEVGALKLGPWSGVTRATTASFMLACLNDSAYIGQAPMICDRRGR